MLKVKVLGISEMQAEAASMAAELRAAEDPAAMAAGAPIRDKWHGLVPILDGNYRDSLTVAHTTKGAAVGTAWLARLPREEQPFIYSKRLEFGESGVTAQPSARPALEAARAEALDAGADEFRSVVKGRRKRQRKVKVPTT
jgi:hypothetical protein